MPLYKYMMKQHLEGFLKRGTLRIGTLYEYRKVENYGPVIGDDAEGTQQTLFEMPEGGRVDLSSDTQEAIYLRQILPGVNNQKVPLQVNFQPGSQIIFGGEAPELYIYCTAATFDAEVMEKFGYDACLEITIPSKFFGVISRTLRHKCDFADLGPIEYTEKRTDWTSPHQSPPWMMKSREYAYQQEVRAIWKPKKATVEPFFIDVPDAIKYCRAYDLTTRRA